MKNRSILARIGAKLVKGKGKKAPVVKAPEPEVMANITATDPETNNVVLTFNNFEEVEAAEFRPTNVKSSIKTGNKYKGFLWGLSE